MVSFFRVEFFANRLKFCWNPSFHCPVPALYTLHVKSISLSKPPPGHHHLTNQLYLHNTKESEARLGIQCLEKEAMNKICLMSKDTAVMCKF